MSEIEKEYGGCLRAFAKRLGRTRRGQKTALVRELAAEIGVSHNLVYKRLRALGGWTSGRRRRKDAGTVTLPGEEAEAILALIREGAAGQQPLSIAAAYHKAVAEGRIPDRGLSASSIQRALHHYGLRPR